MLNELKGALNMTTTENGAPAYVSTKSECLDLFSRIGALRGRDHQEVQALFEKAYVEDKDLAMKILFYARDIRKGLGERQTFRNLLAFLANAYPESVRKNLEWIPEFGRWDDLLCLIETPLRKNVLEMIRKQFVKDMEDVHHGNPVSLLGKWLPSINTSSWKTAWYGREIAKYLDISEREYRKSLTLLRKQIRIIEDNLRRVDYSFYYEDQPSGAMLKYRKAFMKHDMDRYKAYLDDVNSGKKTMHASTLYPYDIVRKLMYTVRHNDLERYALDTAWKNLEDYEDSSNSLCVIDGSGSMYWSGVGIRPIDAALSLGIYFAEHNTGEFHNHFITFSENPRLVEIKGSDIYEKVMYCMGFNEVANTNLEKVFKLLLDTAVKNHMRKDDMPKTLYIISDMEFDSCADDSDMTVFEAAKKAFHEQGYLLPQVVFWNVESRNDQSPVTRNEQGVALVSGATPKLFNMVANGIPDPMTVMYDVLLSERYEMIKA